MRGVALSMTLALAALAGCAEPIDPALEDAAVDAAALADDALHDAVAVPVGHISGTVLGHEGVPLADALVALAGRTTQSTADGSFSFLDVPAGVHVLTASAPGYLATEAPLEVLADAINEAELALALEQLPPRYEVLTFEGYSSWAGIQCRCSFGFDLEPGLKQIILEAEVSDAMFSANQGASYALSAYSKDNHTSLNEDGPNQVRAVLPVDIPDAEDGYVTLRPHSSLLLPEVDRWFTAYVTLVYDAVADEGYTALPVQE